MDECDVFKLLLFFSNQQRKSLLNVINDKVNQKILKFKELEPATF